MNGLVAPLPRRRSELVFAPGGDRGPHVLKDPRTSAYYSLGDEEHFLLTQLDGRCDVEALRTAYATRFGQPLADEDLSEFLESVRERDLLDEPEQADRTTSRKKSNELRGPDESGSPPLGLRFLYWRKSLFDPDSLFTWLAPKLGFFWTRTFLVASAGCIVLAAAILWTSRSELAGSLGGALRWEAAALAWLVLLVVVTGHEFAHGLTCKRFGGEVHEVGFLLLFFMPCFYCNVSDAWLIKEKSKRLWVTFAGGYFELFLWALAVFTWRLTLPDSLLNSLAFVVLSVGGVQSVFNFNPLLKLDGYYLVSDWLEVPNLQQRAWGHVKGWLRWLLWGAPRPVREPRGKLLLGFGVASWVFSLVFLLLMLVGLGRLL